MAPASKANYKSYEAQARLVRAIVAAHPTVKWNYKEIASCYGSDMTEHALNHRFRHIRAQSEIIVAGREANLDMKDLITDESSLPKTVGAVDKSNIAKYFGQSTADGIQFQFRTIKKDADKLRAVADTGGDPSACLDLGTASSFTPTSTPKTPRSRGVASMPASGASTNGSRTVKRGRSSGPAVKLESDDDDDDGDGDSESTQNWSEMDVSTPSKRPRTLDALAAPPPSDQKPGAAPPRLAAARAAAAFAEQQQSSESEAEAARARARARPGALPLHVRDDDAARPSAAFATATATATATAAAPRARSSLFGDVPAFKPPPPPPSTAVSEFLTGGSGGVSSENRFVDDYDPYEGEI